MNKSSYQYYMRKSGVIVRVKDDIVLEYLSSEYKWIPNQEWYVSMFVDGKDDYIKITEEQVNAYLNEKLNSKKITR